MYGRADKDLLHLCARDLRHMWGGDEKAKTLCRIQSSEINSRFTAVFKKLNSIEYIKSHCGFLSPRGFYPPEERNRNISNCRRRSKPVQQQQQQQLTPPAQKDFWYKHMCAVIIVTAHIYHIISSEIIQQLSLRSQFVAGVGNITAGCLKTERRRRCSDELAGYEHRNNYCMDIYWYLLDVCTFCHLIMSEK